MDVVALEGGGSLVKARPLPAALVEAAEDVAAVQMDLPSDWINPGPTDLLDWGLPDSFADRRTQDPSTAFDSLLRASLRLLGDGAGNGGE